MPHYSIFNWTNSLIKIKYVENVNEKRTKLIKLKLENSEIYWKKNSFIEPKYEKKTCSTKIGTWLLYYLRNRSLKYIETIITNKYRLGNHIYLL